MFKYIMLMLLFIPCVFAQNFTFDESILNTDYIQTEPKISSECREQYSQFMKYQPEELVGKYCDVVNKRLVFVLGIVFMMWLFEPLVKRKSEESNNLWIIKYYKWLGLGLLFMTGYGLVII